MLTQIAQFKNSPFTIRMSRGDEITVTEFTNSYDTLIECKKRVMNTVAGNYGVDEMIVTTDTEMWVWEPSDQGQLKGMTGTRDLSIFKNAGSLQVGVSK